jgi:hypothetical protein
MTANGQLDAPAALALTPPAVSARAVRGYAAQREGFTSTLRRTPDTACFQINTAFMAVHLLFPSYDHWEWQVWPRAR